MQGAHKTFQPIFGQQTDPERTPNLQNQKLVTHRTRFFTVTMPRHFIARSLLIRLHFSIGQKGKQTLTRFAHDIRSHSTIMI